MSHFVLIRCFPQLSLAEAPQWRNFFGIRYGPHLPEVRVMKGDYRVTAWRTTCLYGVSHSRASPRLPDGVTSSVSTQTARSARCEWGSGAVCHRMAHFVLIRCYLQPSLAEAPRWRNFFGISADRASPRLFTGELLP